MLPRAAVPELPEVEVAREVIGGVLVGRTITRVEVSDALVAGGLEGIEGRRVTAVERRGKWLCVTLAPESRDDDTRVFAHLGMSGRWLRSEPGSPTARYERARIEARAGERVRGLVYTDTRRLGRIRVVHGDLPAWKALGPDALADGIDAPWLLGALHARRLTIKEALLDQRLIAGVGNIHAIEALWRARIDPRSRADALGLAEVRALARGIRASLALGLRRYERQADAAYVNEAQGENPYRIYSRQGEPCPRCGAVLQRVVLGGRGTTFCPGCQKRVLVPGGARRRDPT